MTNTKRAHGYQFYSPLETEELKCEGLYSEEIIKGNSFEAWIKPSSYQPIMGKVVEERATCIEIPYYGGKFYTYYLVEVEKCPVANLTPIDGILWCNARSEMEGLKPVYLDSTGDIIRIGTNGYDKLVKGKYILNAETGYRLPSSDEWEYAARGGRRNLRYPNGNTFVANDVASSENPYILAFRSYVPKNSWRIETDSRFHPNNDSPHHAGFIRPLFWYKTYANVTEYPPNRWYIYLTESGQRVFDELSAKVHSECESPGPYTLREVLKMKQAIIGKFDGELYEDVLHGEGWRHKNVYIDDWIQNVEFRPSSSWGDGYVEMGNISLAYNLISCCENSEFLGTYA